MCKITSTTETQYHSVLCKDHTTIIKIACMLSCQQAILLFVCKLTVATGTLSGVVFYANAVGVNRTIFLPVESTDALSVFIAWLNLDFGIETCFYDGLQQNMAAICVSFIHYGASRTHSSHSFCYSLLTKVCKVIRQQPSFCLGYTLICKDDPYIGYCSLLNTQHTKKCVVV